MWFFQDLGTSTLRFFSFSADLWFQTPFHDLAVFLGFVCHLLDVGAIAKPMKHTAVAAAVPKNILNMFFWDSSKNHSKIVMVVDRITSFCKQFGASFSFYLFLPKLPRKHAKGHLNDSIFVNFLIHSLQNGWFTDTWPSRMTYSWKRLLQ